LILIVTNSKDEHANLFCGHLKDRQIRFARLDTEQFPTSIKSSLSFDSDSHVALRTLRVPGSDIDLNEVRAVWYRRPEPALLDDALSVEDRAFISDESSHFVSSLYRLLHGAFWVNPLDANRTASFKPLQLQLATEIGLRIPKTIMSNDAEAILAFATSCSSELIYKPFTFHARQKEDGFYKSIYTTKISHDLLKARKEELATCPCIIQEYVEKSVELRVTVVGSRMFACQIDSQRSELANIDWRRWDFSADLYTPFSLPEKIKVQLRCLMQRLGLTFGCVDMIVTPNNDYVFLEINPNGQWYWVETLTSLPIAEHLATMLATQTI
jgi:glutathione synthase/RimK-type ligase-like ATP-grasp enzyme